jgi:hypothetical protein
MIQFLQNLDPTHDSSNLVIKRGIRFWLLNKSSQNISVGTFNSAEQLIPSEKNKPSNLLHNLILCLDK